MAKHPADLYGGENERMFRKTAETLERIFLQRVENSEFDLSHLDPDDFDHEPWHRYIESIGARTIREEEAEGAIYSVCRWDGHTARPADKDDYSHFVVLNPNIGDPYILVPKELALKMVTIGSIPR